MNTTLTERQQRERDYHREHARLHAGALAQPFSFAVLERPQRRWWNAYWSLYGYLSGCNLAGKDVLVVGCGFGDDALRLAKLGARVTAFDLSPDSLRIARALAAREKLAVQFDEMPAEHMRYADNTFDCVVCRDILHHVDIPATMQEIVRVARPGALFVADEIYSHSMTDRIRHAWLVERVLYPKMQRFIYGPAKPYITADERKLNERDLRLIQQPLGPLLLHKYFNFLVTRIVPDGIALLAKGDRIALCCLRPLAHLLAGRVLFAARVVKP